MGKALVFFGGFFLIMAGIILGPYPKSEKVGFVAAMAGMAMLIVWVIMFHCEPDQKPDREWLY